MNRTFSRSNFAFVILTAFVALILVAAFGAAPVLGGPQTIKKVPLSPETAALTDGEQLFQAACAVCHGKGAQGDGPAAKALKTMVPDLTVLSRKNGGKFPVGGVMSSIQGSMPVAHGIPDMPMWGPIFRGASTESQALLRVSNLTNYIKSLQVK